MFIRDDLGRSVVAGEVIGPRTQPEPYIMPTALGVGVILERGAVMERPAVVGEEHVTGSEHELDPKLGPVQNPVEGVERLGLCG